MKLLRVLGKMLRVSLAVLGILLVSLAAGLFLALKNPEWALNPKTFRVGAALAGRFGLILTWDEARVRVESKRLLHKRFDFSFDHFCFNLSNRYQGCMAELRLLAEAAWLGGKIRVLEVGPLTMQRADLSVYLEPSAEEEALEPEFFRLKLPDLVLPEPLKATFFHPVLLQWERLTLWQGEKMLFTGPLTLRMQPDGFGRPQSLSLDLALEKTADLPSGTLQATLRSPSNFWLNDWALTASATGNLPGKGSGQADLSLRPLRPQVYALGLQGAGAAGQIRGDVDLQARLSEGDVQGALSLGIHGLSPHVRGVSAQACGFRVRQQAGRADRMQLHLTCPLRVEVTPVQFASPTQAVKAGLPGNLDIVLKTELETRFFPSLEEPVIGSLDLEWVPVSQQWVTLQGKTQTKFSGIPARFPEGWTALTKLDLWAMVPRFQQLVQALERSPYAVFAPLNALNGEVEVGVSGETDLLRARGKLPLVFRTRLQSQTQAFNADGEGQVDFERSEGVAKSKLDLAFILSDVRLVMPRLGFQNFPQIFPDSRFFDPKKPAKPAATELDYRIKISTPPEKPLHLVSNLTPQAIPIFLDLRVDGPKLGGTVRIGRTPLSILRRHVSIQDFQITLADPTDFSELQGTIRVDYSNYDIDALVLGTIKRPRIVFQSRPPLSQEEILSVLIYGQPYDALDTSQSNSVGNVAAAVADRALRLGSLFLLASTPVESVGYDPTTGYVSARFRLGGSTSLEVGTEEGHTQKVGLRKNIGGNWIINTYVENDSAEGAQRGGAFLDWYKRY